MHKNEAIQLTEHSSDEALRLACGRNDALAQEYLYKRWSGKLLGIPLRYTSSREESVEVLNMAFLKIFASINSYRSQEGGTFSGWMARIVFNTTIDQVRKKTKYLQKNDFNATVEGVVRNEVLSTLAAEDIFQLVQQLPPATRNVFSLFALDGYKHSEIGELLNISEGTSRWHLGQARKTLRDLVNDHYLNV